jgi:hypothetical protein
MDECKALQPGGGVAGCGAVQDDAWGPRRRGRRPWRWGGYSGGFGRESGSAPDGDSCGSGGGSARGAGGASRGKWVGGELLGDCQEAEDSCRYRGKEPKPTPGTSGGR